MPKLIPAAEYSRRAGLDPQFGRLRQLCAAGRIKGAVKLGRDWFIPENTVINRKPGRPPKK